MFVVDANVFVYGLNRTCDEHARCRTFIEKWHSHTTFHRVPFLEVIDPLRIQP